MVHGTVREDQRELETLALEVRRRAGVEPDKAVLSPSIAERVLGVPIRVAPGLNTAACLAQVGDRYRIFIREVGPETNFDVAHELGHYALREIAGYFGPDEERLASQVAAAIIAPVQLVMTITHAFGRGFRPIKPLAKTVCVSQTAAQLRLGEVLEDERAVVTTSGNLLVRTQGAFPWNDVRGVDVASGRRHPGLVDSVLRGGIDEGRVALRAR